MECTSDATGFEKDAALIDTGVLEAAEQPGEIRQKLVDGSWKLCHFESLPKWLQDNEYLQWGHRPPLPSFPVCFKSIFRIHTETGNIWTHLVGCLLFIVIAICTLSVYEQEERLAWAAFFIGAILCLGFSCTFHTLNCHSEFTSKIFSKLDYIGIVTLIVGSAVPWFYYSFYCQYVVKVVYLSSIATLGCTAMIVSLWDYFATPQYRPLRTGVFIALGLSSVVPTIHYIIQNGWSNAISYASVGWAFLMGTLYILGALLYAGRIPERYLPGKCDFLFQSHQIFHVLVVAAACVHYYGISQMMFYRLAGKQCPNELLTH